MMAPSRNTVPSVDWTLQSIFAATAGPARSNASVVTKALRCEKSAIARTQRAATPTSPTRVAPGLRGWALQSILPSPPSVISLDWRESMRARKISKTGDPSHA